MSSSQLIHREKNAGQQLMMFDVQVFHFLSGLKEDFVFELFRPAGRNVLGLLPVLFVDLQNQRPPILLTLQVFLEFLQLGPEHGGRTLVLQGNQDFPKNFVHFEVLQVFRLRNRIKGDFSLPFLQVLLHVQNLLGNLLLFALSDLGEDIEMDQFEHGVEVEFGPLLLDLLLDLFQVELLKSLLEVQFLELLNGHGIYCEVLRNLPVLFDLQHQQIEVVEVGFIFIFPKQILDLNQSLFRQFPLLFPNQIIHQQNPVHQSFLLSVVVVEQESLIDFLVEMQVFEVGGTEVDLFHFLVPIIFVNEKLVVGKVLEVRIQFEHLSN